MVFFESPHRLADALADAVAAFGGLREAAVCRELTKTHEEVVRDSLGGLVRWAADQEQGVRGEVTLVVEGATRRELDEDELRARVADHEADGMSRKDAIAEVARETGQPRRAVYEAAHR